MGVVDGNFFSDAGMRIAALGKTPGSRSEARVVFRISWALGKSGLGGERAGRVAVCRGGPWFSVKGGELVEIGIVLWREKKERFWVCFLDGDVV